MKSWHGEDEAQSLSTILLCVHTCLEGTGNGHGCLEDIVADFAAQLLRQICQKTKIAHVGNQVE